MIEELDAAVTAIERGQTRAVLVHAEGEDFCLGGDIMAWPGADVRELRCRFCKWRKAQPVRTLPTRRCCAPARLGAGRRGLGRPGDARHRDAPVRDTRRRAWPAFCGGGAEGRQAEASLGLRRTLAALQDDHSDKLSLSASACRSARGCLGATDRCPLSAAACAKRRRRPVDLQDGQGVALRSAVQRLLECSPQRRPTLATARCAPSSAAFAA
ncbi:hypothetical protein [Ideonella sp. YS5]|uniref:hypothetical protein n=1 Tax=Ideonella sp. YS5 TaxID=3453714 RepID=UPI003EEF904A